MRNYSFTCSKPHSKNPWWNGSTPSPVKVSLLGLGLLFLNIERNQTPAIKWRKKTRRMHVQAKITSHVSWSCYEFLDLFRLFLTLESRILAHANEKSMGKMLSLQCRVGLATVPVAFLR